MRKRIAISEVFLVAQKFLGLFIYLFSWSSTCAFSLFTLSLLGDTALDWKRHFWCCWTCLSFWIKLGDVSPEREMNCSSFILSQFWVSLICLLSPQEKPLTSHTCGSSSTPAGPRALPSTSAHRRTALGCPTSTTVGPVRAPTTKSTAASSARGRTSSRRSAPMSSATSPLSPEATWPSQRWRGVPVPTTLTTALCCRYVSRALSVRWSELSLPVESLWMVMCWLGCTTAPTHSERPLHSWVGMDNPQRHFWRKSWALESIDSKFMVQKSKPGGVKGDLSVGKPSEDECKSLPAQKAAVDILLLFQIQGQRKVKSQSG